MSTRIEKEKDAGQHVGTCPNLGGPTTDHLDKSFLGINRKWADRYEQLNRGHPQ